MAKKPDATLNNWNVELLRFTGFPSPDFQIKEPNWWYEIVGEQPENRIVQPRKGLFQEVGLFDESELILKVEPFRIDWVFKANQKPEEQDMTTLGEFENGAMQFNNLMTKWFGLKDFPKFQRIAFGAILLHPVKDYHQGYTKLSVYLKSTVAIDTKNSSDFFYQINRPRKSKTNIPNLRINRLTKWSVKKAKLLGIIFNGEQNKTISGEDSFACRLELDINTIPDPDMFFKQKECNEIFYELVNLSFEISKKGDIK